MVFASPLHVGELQTRERGSSVASRSAVPMDNNMPASPSDAVRHEDIEAGLTTNDNVSSMTPQASSASSHCRDKQASGGANNAASAETRLEDRLRGNDTRSAKHLQTFTKRHQKEQSAINKERQEREGAFVSPFKT